MTNKLFRRKNILKDDSIKTNSLKAKSDKVSNTNVDAPSENSAKNSFSQLSQGARAKWSELPSRDRLALTILSVFLLVIGGGYGGYIAHNFANEKKEDYLAAVNDYFWLRAQASNISPTQGSEQDVALDQKITQLLNQVGASNTQVLNNGDAVQISFNHENQTEVSNVLGAMVNSGLKVQQLSMQQNPVDQVITVQATVKQ